MSVLRVSICLYLGVKFSCEVRKGGVTALNVMDASTRRKSQHLCRRNSQLPIHKPLFHLLASTTCKSCAILFKTS